MGLRDLGFGALVVALLGFLIYGAAFGGGVTGFIADVGGVLVDVVQGNVTLDGIIGAVTTLVSGLTIGAIAIVAFFLIAGARLWVEADDTDVEDSTALVPLANLAMAVLVAIIALILGREWLPGTRWWSSDVSALLVTGLVLVGGYYWFTARRTRATPRTVGSDVRGNLEDLSGKWSGVLFAAGFAVLGLLSGLGDAMTPYLGEIAALGVTYVGYIALGATEYVPKELVWLFGDLSPFAFIAIAFFAYAIALMFGD